MDALNRAAINALRYIDKLEARIEELERDNRKLINEYWKDQEIRQDNIFLKKENERLENENRVLLDIIEELREELNNSSHTIFNFYFKKEAEKPSCTLTQPARRKEKLKNKNQDKKKKIKKIDIKA